MSEPTPGESMFLIVGSNETVGLTKVLLDKGRLYYDVSTQKGDSGTPILTKNGVVGVH